MRWLHAGLAVALMAAASSVEATEIRVSASRVERVAGSSALIVTAQVTWANAWRTARNYDAAWLFVKIRPEPNAGWNHIRILSISSESTTPRMECRTSADRIGAFCSPAEAYRGTVTADVRLELDTAGMPARFRASTQIEAKVFGIEMVYIPEGPFSIGDSDPRSIEYAAYYRSDATGASAGPLRIASEAPIRVAAEAGALYYKTNYAQYEGDRQGPIPAEFPKGVRAFYVMKYEVLQGQYADFLNHIPRQAAAFRAIHAAPGYYDGRGTIRLDRTTFTADKPNRPANWVSWDDGTAFADWAGLRPLTELEFTKAARGPVEPIAADFPWGTSSRERLLRRIGIDDELVRTGDADESRLTDATRDALGASYYWVMDLAGSVWEKVVTLGHPTGRAFRGTHGDGVLRDYGIASNTDWPSGDNETGGYGYRGGGYYERGMVDQQFNPYSPVEWRRYGSWGGAPRTVAYGFRAARTAAVR